jgi:hypothetical protein
MSIWTSVLPDYKDNIDVAYPMFGDQVRLVINERLTLFLTIEEAITLSEKMKIAVTKQQEN